MNFRQKAIMFMATGFYSGTIGFAPGTFGSLTAIPICYLLSYVEGAALVVLIAAVILIAVPITGKAEKILKKKDPGAIVLDEICGMMVTFAGIQFSLVTAVGGFVLFRFFDILKPWPVSLAEKKFSGGTGIVIDDVVAGVMANIVLRIGYFLMLK